MEKLSQSNMREAAFMLVFEKFFSPDSCDEIIETARDADEYLFNEDSEKLFKGVCEHTEELDEIISRFSTSRSVSRIGKVSLAVLRIAIYEITSGMTPANVAISEAVRISQIYSLETDTRFVNGVLGAYSRTLPPDEANSSEGTDEP